MTNLDRAEAILAARHYKDQMEGDGAVGCFDAAAAVAELAAAGLLAPDLPAPTLAEMTTAERAATVGMWATINPSDDLPAWRGIIARANRSVALVCNPDDMRMGLKPDPVTASIVTPDPTVPRAWNANGDPAHTEPAPDADGHVYFVAPAPDPIGNDWHLCRKDELTYLDTPAPPNTITLGSKWNNTDALANACDESGRDQITVTDTNGYAFIWAYDAEWWEGSAQPIDAPYTIIHTGREADQ